MKNAAEKIKKLLNKVKFLIPTPLPKGMLEFHHWADSIIWTYDLPDNSSLRFALATSILHLESVSKFEINLFVIKIAIPMSSFKSKRFFSQMLLKGAANQVASGIMQELKEQQEKERAAEKAAAEEAAKPQ